MPVYVDPLYGHGGSASFRWKYSCHMYADTEPELHAAALAIGLQRRWFQNHRADFPHYDLNAQRRAVAVSLDVAQEVTFQHLREYVQRRRIALGIVPAPSASSQSTL